MVIRVLIVAVLWTLIHVYLGLRLVAPLGIGAIGHAVGWMLIAVLALAPFGALFAERAGAGPATEPLEWTGFTAMGLSSVLIILTLVGDLSQLRSWIGASRFSIGVLGVSLLVLVLGAWRAARPTVVRIDVPIADLPPALEGFRIVQLSDLHVGSTLRRPFLERVVTAAMGLEPDLLVLTGDVGDGFPARLGDDVAPLARLAAPLGKFFVTGNHEYYWDALGWIAEMERLGFVPLVNAHRVLARGDDSVVLAGVTDLSAGSMIGGHRSDPEAAIAGAPDDAVRVLLAHNPRSAFVARRLGFDLQLSGHTHGGQYFPFNLLIRLFQPYVAGLHRVGPMWLYVSRGTGYWGPPFRLGAPSEITLIRLVPEPARAEDAAVGRDAGATRVREPG